MALVVDLVPAPAPDVLSVCGGEGDAMGVVEKVFVKVGTVVEVFDDVFFYLAFAGGIMTGFADVKSVVEGTI